MPQSHPDCSMSLQLQQRVPRRPGTRICAPGRQMARDLSSPSMQNIVSGVARNFQLFCAGRLFFCFFCVSSYQLLPATVVLSEVGMLFFFDGDEKRTLAHRMNGVQKSCTPRDLCCQTARGPLETCCRATNSCQCRHAQFYWTAAGEEKRPGHDPRPKKRSEY